MMITDNLSFNLLLIFYFINIIITFIFIRMSINMVLNTQKLLKYYMDIDKLKTKFHCNREIELKEYIEELEKLTNNNPIEH